MKINKWLTINRNGACRITASKPRMEWDEISVLLNINLPDALFERPRLEASIDIPEEAVKADIISAEVLDNVKDVVKKATDLELNINVIKEDEDE